MRGIALMRGTLLRGTSVHTYVHQFHFALSLFWQKMIEMHIFFVYFRAKRWWVCCSGNACNLMTGPTIGLSVSTLQRYLSTYNTCSIHTLDSVFSMKQLFWRIFWLKKYYNLLVTKKLPRIRITPFASQSDILVFLARLSVTSRPYIRSEA